MSISCVSCDGGNPVHPLPAMAAVTRALPLASVLQHASAIHSAGTQVGVDVACTCVQHINKLEHSTPATTDERCTTPSSRTRPTKCMLSGV